MPGEENATTIRDSAPSNQQDEPAHEVVSTTDSIPNAVNTTIHRRSRKIICYSCRASKVKCDEGKPCARCAKRGDACGYPPITSTEFINFLTPGYASSTTANYESSNQDSNSTMAGKEDFEILEVESENENATGNDNDNNGVLDHRGREVSGMASEDDDRSKHSAEAQNHKRTFSTQQHGKSTSTAPRSLSAEDPSPHRRKRAKTEDEREQRRVERLLSNRLAAEKSRERKRQEIEALKAEKQQLEETNWDIAKRLTTLEEHLRVVMEDNDRLRLKQRNEPGAQAQDENSFEASQEERDQLAAQWQELSKRNEMFERERLQFAEEVQLRRKEVEVNKQIPSSEGTSEPVTWHVERQQLLQSMAKLTAEMGKAAKETERLKAEQQQREEEIHKSHNAHKATLLAARDQHAQNLVNMLKQRDEEIGQKHQHIVDLDKLVALKSDALVAAEAHSASREELMKTLEALVTSSEVTIKSKDDTLSAQDETIRRNKLEIESLRLQLAVHKQVQEIYVEDGRSKTVSYKDEPGTNDSGNASVENVSSASLAPHSHSDDEIVVSTTGLLRSSTTMASTSPRPQTTSLLRVSSTGPGSRSRSHSQGPNNQIVTTENLQSKEDSFQPEQDSPLDATFDFRQPMQTRERHRSESKKSDGRSPRRASSGVKTKKVQDREKRDQEEEELSVIQYDDGSKPAHSYTQLIGMAIVESSDRQLRLAEIYRWISDTYSFYSDDVPMRKDWKNAIRSTLSTNKKFVRQWRPGEDPGKGSYWGIDGSDDEFVGRPIYLKSRSSWHRIGKMKNAAS